MNQHDGELGESKHAGTGGEDAEPGASVRGDGKGHEGAEHDGRSGGGANAEGEHPKADGASSDPTAGEHEGPDVANAGRKTEPPAVGK